MLQKLHCDKFSDQGIIQILRTQSIHDFYIDQGNISQISRNQILMSYCPSVQRYHPHLHHYGDCDYDDGHDYDDDVHGKPQDDSQRNRGH